MNNEPVAWQHKVAESWVTTTKDGDDDEWIPLYTHPSKDITDEEIIEVWDKMCSIVLDNDKNITEFARAILRKAQEK